MENVILITITICVLYVVVKMVEMRLTEQEMKPLKNIVRETFIVGGCAFLPVWAYFQFKDNLSDWFGVEPIGGKDILKTPEIFTDAPGF
jgi:hypothetical protein